MEKEKVILETLMRIEQTLEAKPPKIHNVKTASQFLHMDENSFIRFHRAWGIPSYRPTGRRVYFLENDLIKFVTKQKQLS